MSEIKIPESVYRELLDKVDRLEQELASANEQMVNVSEQLAEAKKEITDEQIENIIFQCDGFLKWGVGDHGKQTIRQKIRAIIKESQQ